MQALKSFMLYQVWQGVKAIKAGVDGLVVEGTEGGGFKNPEEVGLYVLLQSIRKHSDIPMVAAGGIVDGIGMAAAFAAGAEGIQMGTRFVSSKESPVHQNYKQAILDSDEQGTYILNKKSKPCVRAIKTDSLTVFMKKVKWICPQCLVLRNFILRVT